MSRYEFILRAGEAHPEILARTIPFRRGREYAAYHIFVKQVGGLLKTLDRLEPEIMNIDDEIWGAGGPINPAYYPVPAEDMLRAVQRGIKGKRDLGVSDAGRDYYQNLHYVREDLDYVLSRFQERSNKRLLLEYRELDRGELDPKDRRTVDAYMGTISGIYDLVDTLRKRIAREKDLHTKSQLPKDYGRVETLYHASVNARVLYKSGFSDKPGDTGLGGSDKLRDNRRSGISFTEDEYVAKEIARVFKELALIARGQVKLRHILGWISKLPSAKQGRIKDFLRYPQVSPSKDEPKHVADLYLGYLKVSDRYDPVFFGQDAYRPRYRIGGVSARNKDTLHHSRWHCSRTD